MNRPNLYARYMQDPVPVRLGNLASSLSALSRSAASETRLDSVPAILDECKHFIEWTGPETEVEVAGELVRLQVQIAGWQRKWDTLKLDPEKTAEVAALARKGSEQVLEWSGLLEE